MNYTKNWRLPQWEEQDRVLRTDFNDAFAVVEEIGSRRDRLQTVTENLARDAYQREVQNRVHHGRGGVTDGMWVNALASREESGGDGHGWNGQYGLYLGDGIEPTLEGILKTAKQVDYISDAPYYAYQSKQAIGEFVSDGYGTLVDVSFYFSKANDSAKPFTFYIRMSRVDTGEAVGQAGPFTGSDTLYGTYRVNFPLEAGSRYHLTVALENGQSYMGSAGFCFSSDIYTGTTLMTFSKRKAAGTLVKTVTVPEGALKAVGLLRWSGGGTVALEVNGKKLVPTKSRTTVNALGETCTEEQFSLDPLPEGALSVTLRMKQSGEMLKVFDYGFIWM